MIRAVRDESDRHLTALCQFQTLNIEKSNKWAIINFKFTYKLITEIKKEINKEVE